MKLRATELLPITAYAAGVSERVFVAIANREPRWCQNPSKAAICDVIDQEGSFDISAFDVS